MTLSPKVETTYRVFVTRHYIAVRYFDVTTTSARRAEDIAKRYARRAYRDVRTEATDNGWQVDLNEPVDVGTPGGRGGLTPFAVVKVAPNVFEPASSHATAMALEEADIARTVVAIEACR